MERFGLPGEAKGAVDKLVKQKEEALAAEEREKFDQPSAPELVTVKTEKITEELVDEDGNMIGFSFIGADDIKRECYFAEDENARQERRGFSDGDLANPVILEMLGKDSPDVFAELESDSIAGPVIRRSAELTHYTAKERRKREAKEKEQSKRDAAIASFRALHGNHQSRAAGENYRLGEKALQVMPYGEPVLTSWIMEHVPGIMTSQKCTKVMDVLIEAGKVEKVEGVRGRYIGYRLLYDM